MRDGERIGDGRGAGALELVRLIRTATRSPDDWQILAERVAAVMASELPAAAAVLALVPPAARGGHEVSQVLHVEPDGTFSIVALLTVPGQATTIHDHVTWCATGVIAGREREEVFQIDEAAGCLISAGSRIDGPGAVNGFAPPGDIHRVTNVGTAVGISLHVYGTHLGRIGSSVRRIYDLPVRA